MVSCIRKHNQLIVMKKNKLYLLLLLVFVAAVALIGFNYKSKKDKEESRVYELLSRKRSDTSAAEWASTKTKAAGFVSTLQAQPKDVQANLGLAALFIQEARVTGNHLYYDKAAMKHINDVLAKEPQNFSALCYKALLYLSQHHFAEGLEIAQQAQAINPNNAFIYGLLTDAYVELGNYKGAVEMSDKMQSVKPDIRAYARVSYLREIYGDYPGAVEAMKLAVSAGPPGTEGTEWARVQLGHLYELTGDVKSAAATYETALLHRPDYAYAVAGLARVAIHAKEYDKAVQYYLKADSLITDNTFKEELADLYTFMGQKEKANAVTQGVVAELSEGAEAADEDETIGHYSDNELALNYAKLGDHAKALKHAELEYNRRPENITVNETLAWVHYKKGDAAKAMQYINAATKTGSKNPDLLARTGLIQAKGGNKATAKTLLQQSVANPGVNVLLQMEAAGALRSL